MRRRLLLPLLALVLGGCGHSAPVSKAAADPAALSWAQIEQQARGQTVHLAMWLGDPAINAYMRDYVVPGVQRRYGVTLDLLPGQDNIVSRLSTEIEAHQARSSIDMVWINGQNFYQLRQIKALYGPFTSALPNDRYVDWSNPFIARDFQEPVDGYECPWGNVQLLLIYDSKTVPDPPRTPAALAQWIHAHPGRFTFDSSFTGLGFLKSLMYAFADSPQELQGKFDLATYRSLSGRVLDWVAGVKTDLWRHGSTFPADVSQLHRLFANGEVDFTMSFNDGEVDNKIDIGLFPKTARAYVLDTGTLQNSHYMGIVARSPHKAAAMAVANFLISPAAQLQKLKPSVWGDGTVLAIDKLPPKWRERFEHVPGRKYAPPRAQIQSRALREPDPEYMIHLNDDFRKRFLGG